MTDKLKEIVDTIIKLDEKLGFRRFVKYTGLVLIIILIINYKTVLKDIIELTTELSGEIHSEKMELRDQLLSELYPILCDFRVAVNADRILFFEYHNSKENIEGIPFKYMDLILQNSKFGYPHAIQEKFTNVNVGVITSLYEKIREDKFAYCSGPNDIIFRNTFPGIHEIVYYKDGSTRQLFLNIPGRSQQPVGLIIIEWIDKDYTKGDLDYEAPKINLNETLTISDKYILEIRTRILSKIY